MSEETEVLQEQQVVEAGDIVNELCKVIDQALKIGFSSFEVIGAIEVAKNITLSYFMNEEEVIDEKQ